MSLLMIIFEQTLLTKTKCMKLNSMENQTTNSLLKIQIQKKLKKKIKQNKSYFHKIFQLLKLLDRRIVIKKEELIKEKMELNSLKIRHELMKQKSNNFQIKKNQNQMHILNKKNNDQIFFFYILIKFFFFIVKIKNNKIENVKKFKNV